ncbi:MAG: CopD family protein, partial [Chloroflexia bacterium]
TGTRYGLAWFLKFFAALILGGIMLFVWRRPRNPNKPQRSFGPAAWDVAAAAGSLLILGQSLSSHAAAIHIAETVSSTSGAAAHSEEAHGLGLPLPVLADWVHMLAASLWAGGLLYMTLVLFPTFKAASYTPDERKAFLAKAIPRFSRLAILGVVVLAITGTYSTILHSADLGVILSTGYGWVLALKVVAFLMLVGIGAINLLRLSPALARTAKTDSPQTSLMGNVRGEAGLVIVALVCAAGLTLLPPPAEASSVQIATATPTVVASTPVPTPGPSIANIVEAGYALTMTIKPSLEGDQFTLNVVNATGAADPLTDVAKVLFRVTPQDVDGGSISYEATAQGDITPVSASWAITEPVFTLDGTYLVTAILQRTVAPDLKAGFYLTLSESSLTSQPVGIVDIRLSTDPSPPISGTATLKLDVRDGTGQPIDGARITVNPLMPAHAHIEPSGPAEPVAGQPGIYTFQVHFIMGGGWLITFNVERNGQPMLKTDASLDVIGPEIDITPTPTP